MNNSNRSLLEVMDDIGNLKKLGYFITRQTGSHLRLTTENGEHHVTIPMHSPLKVDTFSSIINTKIILTLFQNSDIVESRG